MTSFKFPHFPLSPHPHHVYHSLGTHDFLLDMVRDLKTVAFPFPAPF